MPFVGAPQVLEGSFGGQPAGLADLAGREGCLVLFVLGKDRRTGDNDNSAHSQRAPSSLVFGHGLGLCPLQGQCDTRALLGCSRGKRPGKQTGAWP